MLPVVLIVLAAAWRMIALHFPVLGNFSPVMALAFCGGVYFRNRWMWLVPFAALLVSDIYIDRVYAIEYHYTLPLGGALVRLGCFGCGLLLGRAVAGRRSWMNLFRGIMGSAILFYLATNTVSWFGDAAYAHNAAGWWQAMTVGHPEFPPTLYFFRNTLLSDLIFTAGFAWAMESAARRRGETSLRRTPAAR